MSAFSPEWLALREPADARSRNSDTAAALSAWFMQRETISIVDLGSGTGANLRAIAPLLPNTQIWTLIDNDAAALDEARRALTGWADRSTQCGDDLTLTKSAAEITVRFKICNIVEDLEAALETAADLVTASALFDLMPPAFIKALARATAVHRAAFYGVLTYNGLQKWTPHRPADSEIIAAFNRHQMTDKGQGEAAGPLAAGHLADQFRLEGYNVLEGDSPWRLGASDRTLIEELQRGHALAMLELKTVPPKTVEAWVKIIRSAVEIGHTDIFAVPA